jgi:hypothetical protein
MDSVRYTARNFYANNRNAIGNFIYILAFLLLLYLVYVYLLADPGLERYVVKIPMTNLVYGLKGNASSAALPVAGDGAGNNESSKTRFCINYDDTAKDPVRNPRLRILEGGDFTFSWWMYINAWNNAKTNVIKPVICISDPNVSSLQMGKDSAYIMSTFLYPNETKLGIRFQTKPTDSQALTWINNFTDASNNPAIATQSVSNGHNSPVCDISDIDMQRWINITCVVSGRVVDVYYDGKLNRSCVLPGPVMGSSGNSPQYANTSLSGGFNGYLNSLFFAGMALTPDRIYAIYQAGPGGQGGWLSSLGSLMPSTTGINLAYSGYPNTSY